MREALRWALLKPMVNVSVCMRCVNWESPLSEGFRIKPMMLNDRELINFFYTG